MSFLGLHTHDLGPGSREAAGRGQRMPKGETGVGFVSYSRKLVSGMHRGPFKYTLDFGGPSLNAKDQYHSANT